MKPFLPILILTLALCLCACEREYQPNESTETFYGAFGVAELFNPGASVTIRNLDSQFNLSTSSHSATVDERGEFRVDNEFSRYVQTEVKGAYAHVPGGRMTTSPITLKAVSDLTEGEIRVNVLTTLEASALKYYLKDSSPTKSGSLTFEQARHKADSAVFAAFGIPYTEGLRFDKITVQSGADWSAILLAVEIILFSDRTDAEVNQYLASVLSQLESTGQFTVKPDDYLLTLDTDQVYQFLITVLHFQVVPPFVNYLDQNGDGVPDSLGIHADPSSVEMDWDQTDLTLAVHAHGGYSVTISPGGWIRLKGNDQGSFSSSALDFSVDQNTGSEERSAVITLDSVNGSSTSIYVQQHPDYARHPLVLTPGNWFSISDYSKAYHILLEGTFTHPELSQIFNRISGSTNLRELDLSKVETPDRVIGRYDWGGEELCDTPIRDVPALKTLILPEHAETVYGALLAPDACLLDRLEFGADTQTLIVSIDTEDSFMGRCWRPASLEEIPSSVKTLQGGLFCGWDWIEDMRFAPGTVVLMDRSTFHGAGMKRLEFGRDCRLGMSPDDSDWSSLSFCGRMEQLVFGDGCVLEVPFLLFVNESDDYGTMQSVHLKEIVFGNDVQIHALTGTGHFVYGCYHLEKLSFGSNVQFIPSNQDGAVWTPIFRDCNIEKLTFGAEGGLSLRKNMFGECHIGEIALTGNLSKLSIEDHFCDCAIDEFILDYRTHVAFDIASQAFGWCGTINDNERNSTGVRLIYDGDYASRPIVERTILEYHTDEPTVELVQENTDFENWWKYDLEVVLGPSVTRIFRINNPCLTKVSGISGRITRLDYGAFEGCSHLKQFTWPDGMVRVSDSCFSGCSSLERIDNLPKSNFIIGARAFSGTALTDATGILAASVSVGDGAFSSCGQITSVQLPSWMTYVPSDLFSGCSKLSSVVLPSSLTVVNSGAFSGCNITSTDFLSSVDDLDISALSGWAGDVLDLPANIRQIHGRISGKVDGTYLSKIIFRGGSDQIAVSLNEIKEAEILTPCSHIESIQTDIRLESLRLPGSLQSIDYLYCPGLYAFYIHAKTPPVIHGDAFDPAKTDPDILIHIPVGSRALYESTSVWSAFKGHYVEDL